MKIRNLSLMLLVFTLIVNVPLVNVEGQLSTSVYVDPPSVVDSTKYTPGTSFTITIKIANVVKLNSWEVKLRYNPILLYTNKSLIAEGTFLKGTSFPRRSTLFQSYITEDYVQLGSTLLSNVGVNGSGTLAQVTFKVLSLGDCVLHLYDTKLSDPNLNPISHTTQDGYFANVEPNRTPTASFLFTPSFPAWEETVANVTFDASASHDPDGSVISYLWFFGDKTNVTVSSPVVSHLYYRTTIEPSGEWRYVARLFVVDNDGITGNATSKEVVIRLRHDIALHNIVVSPTQALINTKITINVTAKNEGMVTETFNVTAYYGLTQWTLLQTVTVNTLEPLEEKNLTFFWDTTSSISGEYSIRAEASRVQNETDMSDNIVDAKATLFPYPLASFLYTPNETRVNESVVFNASLSSGFLQNYLWNFGDGSAANTTDPIVTHVYRAMGTYTVTLVVIDYFRLNNTASQSISISKASSSISLSLSSTTSIVGSNITFSGSISPVRSRANVTLFFRISGESLWNLLANSTTNTEGQYSHSWIPPEAGTYEFKAVFNGDDIYSGNESDVVTLIAKWSGTIRLSATPKSLTLGENVTVYGWISPKHSGASVLVLYREEQGSWTALGNTFTDSNGNFTYLWKPSSAGVYEIKVSWDGDLTAYGNESDVLTVTVEEESPNLTPQFDLTPFLWAITILAVGATALFVLRFLISNRRRSKRN